MNRSASAFSEVDHATEPVSFAQARPSCRSRTRCRRGRRRWSRQHARAVCTPRGVSLLYCHLNLPVVASTATTWSASFEKITSSVVATGGLLDRTTALVAPFLDARSGCRAPRARRPSCRHRARPPAEQRRTRDPAADLRSPANFPRRRRAAHRNVPVALADVHGVGETRRPCAEHPAARPSVRPIGGHETST